MSMSVLESPNMTAARRVAAGPFDVSNRARRIGSGTWRTCLAQIDRNPRRYAQSIEQPQGERSSLWCRRQAEAGRGKALEPCSTRKQPGSAIWAW